KSGLALDIRKHTNSYDPQTGSYTGDVTSIGEEAIKFIETLGFIERRSIEAFEEISSLLDESVTAGDHIDVYNLAKSIASDLADESMFAWGESFIETFSTMTALISGSWGRGFS